MELLNHLNEVQREAVMHTEGPLLIFAGAGSGKTRVLTHRIAYLIEEAGVKPEQILAITFTNKAAREMKERVERLLSEKSADIWVSTFHAACVRILRREIGKIGYSNQFNIIDSKDQLDIIGQCLKELNMDSKKFPARGMLSGISDAKNKLMSVQKYESRASEYFEEVVAKVYRLYQKKLTESSALDFDDLIMITVKLFEEKPDVLDYYQHKFKHIFVDEYQDTNHAQYKFINLLAKHHRNICVVGDEDQCIVEGMKINTPEGSVPVEKIKVDQTVVSPSGRGEVMVGTINKMMRKEYQGSVVKIKTRTGKEIKATPNHVVFGKLNPVPGIYYVYLMYKKGVGYRIGQTQGIRSRDGEIVNGLSVRLNQEHADKMWILKVCQAKEEAAYFEQLLGFKYGIPTTVFHVVGRKIILTQKHVDDIFKEIDTEKAALKLMNDFMICEEYPHHIPNAVIRGQVSRKIVNITFFGGRKTGMDSSWHSHRICLNTSDGDLKEKVLNAEFPVRDGNRNTWRIETERKDYDEANIYAKDIIKLDDCLEIYKRARLTKDKSFAYMPIAHLKPFMSIPVMENEEIVEDIIEEVTVEEYDGFVYDLSVPYFRQYICEDVVVHNSIFGWRGADVRNIMQFEHDYPDASVIKLEQNYRSTTNILAAANQVICNNILRANKSLWTDNKTGERIVWYKAYTEYDEASFVADEMQCLRSRYHYGDMAVLYRTNAQSRVLEDIFMKKGIPYQMVGGLRFYERKEIKDLIAYLRVISNPTDYISLKRIINVPKRGIGPATLDKIELFANQMGVNPADVIRDIESMPVLSANVKGKIKGFRSLLMQLMELIDTMKVTAIARAVLDQTGYLKQLAAEQTPEAETRIENIYEFLSVTKEFDETHEEPRLSEFLEQIALITDIDKVSEKNGVLLMTIHAAKGLEFPVVFMVGMEDGIFPLGRAMEDSKQMEEERRLCYVGITRAEEKLYVCNALQRTLYGRVQLNKPSVFLEEMLSQLDIRSGY